VDFCHSKLFSNFNGHGFSNALGHHKIQQENISFVVVIHKHPVGRIKEFACESFGDSASGSKLPTPADQEVSYGFNFVALKPTIAEKASKSVVAVFEHYHIPGKNHISLMTCNMLQIRLLTDGFDQAHRIGIDVLSV
jgi:metallophosphoesterase superfamily enzyme